MKIANSNVHFASNHTETSKHIRRESLVEGFSAESGAWDPANLKKGTSITSEDTKFFDQQNLKRLEDVRKRAQRNEGQLKPQENIPLTVGINKVAGVEVTLSQEARKSQSKNVVPSQKKETSLGDPKYAQEALLIKRMVEALTGKKIDIGTPDINNAEKDTGAEGVGTASVVDNSAQDDTGEDMRNDEGSEWGLQYDYHESYSETEKTTFSAEGVVKTEDGQEISIGVELNMSRAFREEHNVNLRLGAAALSDPLVVNFNGSAAQLTETKFAFDMDADGQDEQISFVDSNSGFLALDNNEDGVVNNGTELFGPSTGEGFSELSVYDKDGNGWIDENDSVYDKLRVWSKDVEGKDTLSRLGQRGIGAIYLDRESTPFAIKDDQNVLQGQVRSSGIFLGEKGTVGTIQQVDLAV